MALCNTDLITVQFTVQREQADKLFGPFADTLLHFKQAEERRVESKKRRTRNNSGNGLQVLDVKDPIECGGLLAQLESGGFELVGTWWQRRRDKQNLAQKYLNIRFTFARELREDAHPDFLRARDDLMGLFARLVNRSFWGVRIYDNPLFRHQEEVEGRRALSMNLGDRKDKDQEVWDRDKDGEKIGDAPKTLQASFVLAFEEDDFVLLEVQKV